VTASLAAGSVKSTAAPSRLVASLVMSGMLAMLSAVVSAVCGIDPGRCRSGRRSEAEAK
jgi:hypothetical protein